MLKKSVTSQTFNLIQTPTSLVASKIYAVLYGSVTSYHSQEPLARPALRSACYQQYYVVLYETVTSMLKT